ncbi:MAG: hypothetical protein ACM3MI_15775, partial [Clostridiales bacterium]
EFSGPFIFPDETAYNSLAQNIVHGKLYGKLGVFSPGYPILLSLTYYVSNNYFVIYQMMLVISALISSTIIFPAYFILDKYCSKVVSVLGAIAVSTSVPLNFFSFTLMTEVLFTPLFLFSIWFLLKSYDTKDKKWALLASLSTVYLYITRSTGLAMLIAFILTFIYYVLTNLKEERALVLIQKKKIIIISFIFLLSAWLIYSTYFVDIHHPFNSDLKKSYNFGSAYDIKKYIEIDQHLTEELRKNQVTDPVSIDKEYTGKNQLSNSEKYGIVNFVNIGFLSNFGKLFINLFNYILVASYLFLFLIVYYFILLVSSKKLLENHSLSIPVFYAFISSIFLIAFTLVFLAEGRAENRIIGRYVEPSIPIIMLLGIICISNFDQEILDKKNVLRFTLISIPLVLIIPYIFTWDNVIFNLFNDLQDNPTLYAYNIFYGYPASHAFDIFYNSYIITPEQPISEYFLPSLLMSGFLLVTLALITLSINNRRYISLLLGFIILSSLVFSAPLYHISVSKSKDSENSIARYLANNTNEETIYLIDLATTYNEKRTGNFVYGFWNRGDVGSVNSKKIPPNITQGYKKTYLISTKSLKYDIAAKDGKYVLYRIS